MHAIDIVDILFYDNIHILNVIEHLTFLTFWQIKFPESNFKEYDFVNKHLFKKKFGSTALSCYFFPSPINRNVNVLFEIKGLSLTG